MKTTNGTMPSHESGEGLDRLAITKIERRTNGGGVWVRGTLAGCRFSALVFAEHAAHPDWELGDSRIAKLWLKRLADGQIVANFDRGWDVRPVDEPTKRIVDLLAAGLAEAVYGE